jgi:hypothetical protein
MKNIIMKLIKIYNTNNINHLKFSLTIKIGTNTYINVITLLNSNVKL